MRLTPVLHDISLLPVKGIEDKKRGITTIEEADIDNTYKVRLFADLWLAACLIFAGLCLGVLLHPLRKIVPYKTTTLSFLLIVRLLVLLPLLLLKVEHLDFIAVLKRDRRRRFDLLFLHFFAFYRSGCSHNSVLDHSEYGRNTNGKTLPVTVLPPESAFW